jgi:hypothetical protein
VRHDDKLTGWTFECPVDSGGKPQEPLGGIVLREMRHEGHNFAREVRLLGFCIEIEHVDESGNVTHSKKWLRTLSASMGFTISQIRKLEPTPILNHPTWKEKFEWLKDFDDALNFSDYIQDPQGTYSGYGVAATFEAPTLIANLGFTDCDYAGLSIEQVFLFSRYSDNPPHEPTGFLSAARFHPLVKYQLKRNPAFDSRKRHTRVASIRFDFRLHLYLDSKFDTKNAPQDKNTVVNQAGLFADRDTIAKRKLFSGVSAASFSAVEKPVVLEVTGPGLVQGFTDSTPLDIPRLDRLHKVDCWDNVHWWGLRATPNRYISAPGAFHAAHIHWRWGSVLAKVDSLLADVINALPTVSGVSSPTGVVDIGSHFTPGTPLVDPGIAWQTIQVAVTKNTKRFDPGQQRLVDLMDTEWETLFETNNRPAPEKIQDGADIVLWYSTEVRSRVTLPLDGKPTVFSAPGGTVFVHGIFFAHDDEMTGATVGTTSAEHRPDSASEIEAAKTWFRSA